ncbi:hypothetical protein RIF29_11046 [Crotalaria pallida]|uniref:Uncharacterized protein n=1 Tax=Crotalaria pallida TaxID=3830 RepID=A0AAN9IKA7_CROPI
MYHHIIWLLCTLHTTFEQLNTKVNFSFRPIIGVVGTVSEGGEDFFRGVLESMQSVYLNRNPTAKAILDLVHSVENNSLCYDHLAFRTFGVNGYGIDSMASFFFFSGLWIHTAEGVEVSWQKVGSIVVFSSC